MKNFKEHFEYKDGVGILKYKKHWWSRWRYSYDYETKGLNSCSHGAGRKMSRSAAKKTLSLDEFKKSMEGIYTTTANITTIDEAPMAYKDTEEIKSIIVDTVDISYCMKPKINIKAAE